MRRALLFVAAAAALALPAGAAANIELKGVTVDSERTVRATVVTSEPTVVAPLLTEDGHGVAGLSAENLGRAKSIDTLLDRSRSMAGQPLTDAIAAARVFVGAKPDPDRIQVVAFGSKAVALTGFSSSRTDADSALGSLSVDTHPGTRLYDAVVLAAKSLLSEPLPARVIILVTDGRDTDSDASLDDAIAAARKADASVYPIAIQSSQFDPEPLKQLASETGGTYYPAASSSALKRIYSSIASELRRTWQMEYVTNAVPGDEIALEAEANGDKTTTHVKVPGELVPPPESKPRLPSAFVSSPGGTVLLALGTGLIVLLAVAFALASKKGAWVKSRLAPHVTEAPAGVKRPRERQRLAFASGLLSATESAFGHIGHWQRLGNVLERADLPLRTAEFFYIMGASGLFAGFVASVAGLALPIVLLSLLGGGAVPYAFVAYKARKRLKAFENQLPDLLVTMAASLKAGHSFRQGIQTVVDEGQEPASKEFQRVLTETRLGRPMDEALAEMTKRVGSKNFEFVISAVTIQRQIGGSLAGLFDMVADTVRQRQQFQRKIRGLTAMGRMSAYVLIGLPFFVLATVTMANGEFMDPLYHSHMGHVLLITMVVMMGIGSLILRKIVSFKG